MASKSRFALRALIWAAIVGALVVAWLHAGKPDLDDAHLSLERSRRLAYVRAGEPLPGTPDLANLASRLAAQSQTIGAPVLIRIFKREFELEIWLKREGRFHLFQSYPICRWSGRLGPKIAQGDRQAPEGFYTVDAKALNPNSRWHRSFNLGFPNAYDRAHQRTGTYLMVHGGCSSVGCYAMTNAVMDEIWQLVTAALRQGQKAFQAQVFPFRMTQARLDSYKEHPHYSFWLDLKKGHDLFDAHGLPPRVRVCSGRYEFERAAVEADGSRRIETRCSQDARRAQSGTERTANLNGYR